jgi:Fe-S cluster biogenesis protein NfuA
VAELALLCRRGILHWRSALPAPSNSETLKKRIIQVLTEEVGPALELDGSGIEVLDVSDGIVQVRLCNVCNGCPSTIMTVIMGIEEELRRHVPEVEYLEAVY